MGAKQKFEMLKLKDRMDKLSDELEVKIDKVYDEIERLTVWINGAKNDIAGLHARVVKLKDQSEKLKTLDVGIKLVDDANYDNAKRITELEKANPLSKHLADWKSLIDEQGTQQIQLYDRLEKAWQVIDDLSERLDEVEARTHYCGRTAPPSCADGL